MKYFLDTEFIESFHKPLFGKRRHFVDLISIGLGNEHRRGYYAISTEFRERDAGPWVKKNVLPQLYPKNGNTRDFWKSNREIRKDLLYFFGCQLKAAEATPESISPAGLVMTIEKRKWAAPPGIEIYGYFADYDWVLLCSLFGTMMDLPEGFPMHCIDLKQMLDAKVRQKMLPGSDFDADLKAIKCHPRYPKQYGEHHARKDAEWDLDLYHFIESTWF